MTDAQRAHLIRDPKLRSIIDTPIDYSKHVHPSLIQSLCSSIISQQVSVAAARTIFGRFLDLFSQGEVHVSELVELEHATLRQQGLSNQKASYIQNVGSFFLQHGISDASVAELSDDEIVDLLTQIKGVGIWTARMILIFHLGRLDIFPVGDLVIRKKMIELYDLNGSKKEMTQAMNRIADVWTPYRSIASRLLWSHYVLEGNG